MTNQRPVGHIDRAVNSLADLRLSSETLDSILGHIGRLGVGVMDGWDAAAATMVERDKVTTFGATDERVEPIDQMQYDSRGGPCVDALQGGVQYFDGTSFPARWQGFAEAAADAGIYSVVSFPMKVGDETVGALNFYSSERDAIRGGDREEGLLFASQAAVALDNAQKLRDSQEQVVQLEEGLETRTMIGQATGLLMAQEGLTSEEAFQKLVKISQNANIKLRDIAKRYVDGWEKKANNVNEEV
jgi:transcriptional regulator with GAF, ATPase, and Fis domain